MFKVQQQLASEKVLKATTKLVPFNTIHHLNGVNNNTINACSQIKSYSYYNNGQQLHQRCMTMNMSTSTKTSTPKDKYVKVLYRRHIKGYNDTLKQQIYLLRKKSKKRIFKLPKILVGQQILPQPVPSPPNIVSPLKEIAQTSTSRQEAVSKVKELQIFELILQWFRDNWGVLVLNCGSLATLTAFTRTDILELRLLSITGSLSSIIYFLTRPPPIVKLPILWSSIFVFTNSIMVYKIFSERKGKTKRVLTEQEEKLYEEHFLPYGMTPRQFEKLLSIAKPLNLPRGTVLLKQGDEITSVYLVLDGKTEAITTAARRVTAASSSRGNQKKLAGGDSGAWIGEFAFLEKLSQSVSSTTTTTNTIATATAATVVPTTTSATNGAISNNNSSTDSNEISPIQKKKTNLSEKESVVLTEVTPSTIPSTNNEQHPSSNNNNQLHPQFISDDGKNNDKSIKKIPNESSTASTPHPQPPNNVMIPITRRSFHTYISTQDSILYEWDHDDLIELLRTSSSDMKSALTRAMTAAVVNKVVNLYISKEISDQPIWKKWIGESWDSSIMPSPPSSSSSPTPPLSSSVKNTTAITPA